MPIPTPINIRPLPPDVWHDRSRHRNEIIKTHLKLIRSEAHRVHRFAWRSFQYDDLESEAAIALNRAIDLYRLDEGAKFGTFAVIKMRSHLSHYIRDKGSKSRSAKETVDRVLKAREQLALNGLNLSLDQTAQRLNIQKWDDLEFEYRVQTVSFDNLVHDYPQNAQDDNEFDSAARARDHQLTRRTFSKLPRCDRLIITQMIRSGGRANSQLELDAIEAFKTIYLKLRGETCQHSSK